MIKKKIKKKDNIINFPAKLSCFIDKFPSFASSKEPAKIPALPDLLFFDPDLKFQGIV